MVSSSGTPYLRSGWLAALRGCLLCVVLVVGPNLVLAQVPEAAAALGIGDTHGSLSFLPWEQIDPYSGNVLLTVTDLDLPGNAGFNLTIRRHYNGKTGLTMYLDCGFPRIATVAAPVVPVRAYPIILMPDGSQVRMLQDPNDSTSHLNRTGNLGERIR